MGEEDTSIDNDETMAATKQPRRDRLLVRGDTVGRYLVLQMLGAGGMGVVYGAYDPELDRKVALKLLYADLDEGQSTTGRGRLAREAQAMARLSHPNVITVHDVGEHDGQVFVAMEFIDGETLEDWLEKRRPWPEVLSAFVSAGQGLAAAHAKGLVHRDFKPENVMIGVDGRVRVLDFGLARPAGDGVDATVEDSKVRPRSDALSQDITAAGSLVGTPAYMAPEQHLGDEVGPAADQFSFCVALYRGLYGERPFVADNLAALAVAVTEGNAKPPPKNANVPLRLHRVISRGLSVDPRERFESIEQLLSALLEDPAVRRRRLGLVGVVAVGLGGAFGLGLFGGAEDEPCSDMGAHLAGVWDDGRAKEVETAMIEASASLGTETWARVGGRLGAYAQGWVEARTDACEATQVRGEQSAELMDRRMVCLDQRLEQFEALVGVLAEADAAVVRRAVGAVTRLPNIERCADHAALAAELPPPEDPAVAERVKQLRLENARANSFKLAGRYETGSEIVAKVVEDARETGYAPVLAEALLKQGGFQMVGAKPAQAEETLLEAYRLAIEIGHAKVAASAAAGLVRVVGQKQSRHEAAAVWSVQAIALAEAEGSVETRTNAFTSVGLAEDAAGRYDEAEEHHRAALELKRDSSGPDDPSVATSLNNLANIAQARGDYASATQLHLEALALWEDALGPMHPNVGSVLNNLGIDAKRQGDYENAAVYYERALANFEASLGPEHPKVAVALNNIGNVASEQEDYAQARASYERALDLFAKLQGPEHVNVGSVLTNLSSVALGQDDYVAAEDYNRRGLAIIEATEGTEHPRAALPLTGLGRALNGQKRFTEALVHLGRALALRAGEDLDPLPRGETRNAMARALWAAPPTKGRDRKRARELARLAREDFVQAGDAAVLELRNIERWLASHDEGGAAGGR